MNKYVVLFGCMFLLATASFYVYGHRVVDSGASMMWVSHTEYWRGDEASTIVRVADYKGEPFMVDNCTANILYPDKTVFVENAPLTASDISGNWYRSDSLSGAPLGTYEQEVVCVKAGVKIVSSQSFHLNPALEEIAVMSDYLGQSNLSALSSGILELSDSQQNLSLTLEKLAIVKSLVEENQAHLNCSANVSGICSELQTLSLALDQLRISRQDYLDQINDSVGMISAMTAGYSEKIDSIAGSVFEVLTFSRDINRTTTDILDQMQGEVHISIIS